MEDKTFELIEKMYAEMQNGFKKVDDRLGKIEIIIENDIKPKISLCLDELVTVKEKLQEHDKRFDTIESKLEQH